MDKVIMKYNPAFLSPEELVASFVVRHRELETIMRIIKENVTKSNQHVLVIGPRGIGKTMLVLRAAEEIRRDKELSEKWYPLVFSEESYQVSTCGEFWLESLFHLSQQTKDERWQRTYEELKDETDEKRLRERALAQLMDFADEQGKRILLVVENLNMLLGDQLSDEDAWAMRHTLQNEPRIMLLASATSRFEQVKVEGKPMFDLFRFIELKPLDGAECRALWAVVTVTGEKLNERRMRPLEILTGGNPRLLVIVSNFAAKMSLKELMNDLLHLVDEHTEYFKSHLDNLPAVERKVYLALAEIYDSATARQVAKAARLNVNKTSSLLGRLIERGAVVEANGRARAKEYLVAERMYNIYYLMRKRGVTSWRVKALVHFMVGFYAPEELVSLTQRIAEEACQLEPEFRGYHYLAYEGILECASSRILQDKLIEATPGSFFEISDIPDSIKQLQNKKLGQLLKEADALSKKPDQQDKAEGLYRQAIEMAPNKGLPLMLLGEFLRMHLKRYQEAEKVYRKAIEIEPNNFWTWTLLGELLSVNLKDYKEAEKAFKKAIELKPDHHWTWEQFGRLLHKGLARYDEAEQAYRKAIEFGSDCSVVWTYLGELLHKELGRYEEAEKAYRKAIEIKPKSAWKHIELGKVLAKLERYNEAEGVFRKAIEIEPKNAPAWAYLGRLLHIDLGRPDEAEKACRKAIEIDPAYPCPWVYLGELLQRRGNYEEAERAYRTAIEKGLDCSYACYVWENLARLLIEKLGRPTDALQLAEKYLVEHPKDSRMRNALAWTFYKYGPADLLTKAETWAEEGLAMEPDKASYQHTLASILCALGKKTKAIEFARKYLEDVEGVKKTIDDAVSLFGEFAAMGFGKEAIEVLEKSESAKVLEPLVVGLRLYLGEDVKAAVEIMEVAKDVVKRIEERRKQIEDEKKK